MPAWADPTADLNRNLTRLATDPRDIAALIGAGEAALALGDPRAATGFFARAQEIAPNDPRVKAGLGHAMVQLERPAEALRMFDQAAKGGVALATLQADRAYAYDLTGQPERAQADYQAALARNPDDAEIIRRYAVSLGLIGEWQKADVVLQPLLYKSDKAAWRNRAFILAMNGQLRKAKEITQQVMPKPLADGMAPFMDRMPLLNTLQKAQAVHFGRFPAGMMQMAAAKEAPAPVAPAAPARKLTRAQQRAVDRAAKERAEAAARLAEQQKAQAERLAAEQQAKAARLAAQQQEQARLTAQREQAARAEAARLSAQRAEAERLAAARAATPPTRTAAVTPTPQAPPVNPPAPQPTPAPATPAPAQTQPLPQPGFVSVPSQSAAFVGPPAPAEAGPRPTPMAAAPTRPETPAAAAPQPASAASDTPPIPLEERRDLADIMRTIAIPDAEKRTTVAAVDLNEVARLQAEKKKADAIAAAEKAKAAKLKAEAEKKKAEAEKKKAEEAERKRNPSRNWVQVATGRDLKALAWDWRNFRKKQADLYAGKTAWTSEWGQTNRMVIGPFASVEAAKKFEGEVKKAGGTAFVWQSTAGLAVDKLAVQ